MAAADPRPLPDPVVMKQGHLQWRQYNPAHEVEPLPCLALWCCGVCSLLLIPVERAEYLQEECPPSLYPINPDHLESPGETRSCPSKLMN